MRVMVTGAAGFIGSHLVQELNAHGHEAVGVDRADGDLRIQWKAQQLVDEIQPEACVHLAAKVGRLFGEESPLETITDNAVMTTHVARACGERGVRLAYASTSEVYGDQGDSVQDEDLIVGIPHNLYGLSKRWGEEACELYAPEGLTILRLSMPYGGGHPPGRGRAALTNFLWNAKCRESIPVHRGAERSWCYIADTVRAIRCILEDGRGEAWNVGRDDNRTTMLTVARMACDLVGAPYSLIEEVDPPERQTVVKRLSTEKLWSLGWRPVVELDEGMRRTLAWLESAERVAA